MITITRRRATQLRPVPRRAQTSRRGPGPAVGFIGGKEGLIMKSDCGDVGIEYQLQSPAMEGTIASLRQFKTLSL